MKTVVPPINIGSIIPTAQVDLRIKSVMSVKGSKLAEARRVKQVQRPPQEVIMPQSLPVNLIMNSSMVRSPSKSPSRSPARSFKMEEKLSQSVLIERKAQKNSA